MTWDINKDIKRLQSSASIETKRLADEIKKKDPDFVDLTLGEPLFATEKKIVDIACRQMNLGDTHYVTGKGRLSLRKKIYEAYAKKMYSIDPENILITPGAKYAIYLVLKVLLNENDGVIILDPSWVSYEQIVRSCGGQGIHVALNAHDQYTVTEKLLNEYYEESVKVLIINNPNNPTGRILRNEEMKEIICFCQKKQIYLVADEVYEAVDFKKSFISFLKFKNQYANIVIVNGFSKSHAMTGWRIGYCITPEYLMEYLYKLYSHTITGIPGFIQEAALGALDTEDNVNLMCEFYRKNCEYAVKKINEIPGLSCAMPEGTFYLWMHIDTKIYPTTDAARYILKYGRVAGVAGIEYGRGFHDYLRLSASCSQELLSAGIRNLKSMYENGGNYEKRY